MTRTEPPEDASASCAQLREALRSAASALKENGPRFALAGSYALWAYGAPEPSHDVDLVVAESDVADAEANTTVSEIAQRWGFAHTGRFAVLYRQTYGQSPHATLDQ